MSRLLNDWIQIYEAGPAMLWTVVAIGFLSGIMIIRYRRRPWIQRLAEAKARGRELREQSEKQNAGDAGAASALPSRSGPRPETAGLFLSTAGEGVPDRVVFIVDVSRSLTPAQFAMSKSELLGGLDSLKEGAFYQILFFSGPVWFAHQRLVSGGERGEDVVIRDGECRHRWKYAFGGHLYEGKDDAHPSGEWRVVNADNLAATRRDIEEVGKSDGTTWHLPLRTALSLEPAPTRIFFMTDGEIARQDEIVEGILALSRERGNPVIHTTALMVPGASKSLHRLATSTGGRHALVIAGGHVLRDKDLAAYLEEKGITLD